MTGVAKVIIEMPDGTTYTLSNIKDLVLDANYDHTAAIDPAEYKWGVPPPLSSVITATDVSYDVQLKATELLVTKDVKATPTATDAFTASTAALTSFGANAAQQAIDKIHDELHDLFKDNGHLGKHVADQLKSIEIDLHTPKPSGPQERLMARYPVLHQWADRPCSHGGKDLVRGIIMHLNDTHHPDILSQQDPWDRERIATWLENLPLDITLKEEA